MVDGVSRRADAGARRSAAAARGLTVRQLVTLASLVEKETGKPEERPLVAAVYAEPPARSAWACSAIRPSSTRSSGPAGTPATSRATTCRFDSPYNTYRYAGLPPGPIAAPGRASLEAAAIPADVPYLYFVSRNDGSHVFAATLDEHNRNVFEYQIKPNRK